MRVEERSQRLLRGIGWKIIGNTSGSKLMSLNYVQAKDEAGTKILKLWMNRGFTTPSGVYDKAVR